ncbi:hypothetical protein UFOVP662_53 [uncultured Caudovirales phage]|uniref:Holin of 3TMs, for gene-transfer release n=1 Tax=uncultured Caudovirales phage TaxID=2100421 RepID=A0A6J5NM15_9CAUD|nr:hypothetical protein UFOVP662_53 [uncultured Caudovirales phage]CAB4181602.1 hypothetical protein UFOVP1067_53 [uncultured Caudovirales phage]
MITLITTLVSFLAGGLPKLLGFFQDRADKSHEMAMARLQTERELELRKAGFEAQQRVEEIRVEGQMIEAASAERSALYAHDIAIGQNASQWMVNLRAGVRPLITYGLFLLLVFVDVAGFVYAWQHGVDFQIMLDNIWDDETQIIWASVISFWFGSQAFSKK